MDKLEGLLTADNTVQINMEDGRVQHFKTTVTKLLPEDEAKKHLAHLAEIGFYGKVSLCRDITKPKMIHITIEETIKPNRRSK